MPMDSIDSTQINNVVPCVLWLYCVDSSFADSSFAIWPVIDVTGPCVIWFYFVDSSFEEENQSIQGHVTSITRQIIISTRFVSHLFQQDSVLFDDFKMLFLE